MKQNRFPAFAVAALLPFASQVNAQESSANAVPQTTLRGELGRVKLLPALDMSGAARLQIKDASKPIAVSHTENAPTESSRISVPQFAEEKPKEIKHPRWRALLTKGKIAAHGFDVCIKAGRPGITSSPFPTSGQTFAPPR